MTTMIKTHEESGASEPVGLGQLIKGATGRVGIQPCASCERRAQRLDRWVRFGSVGGARGAGSGRRSAVVVAVTVTAAVGGSVAGGMLGKKVGSAAGTRLREKLQRPGYAAGACGLSGRLCRKEWHGPRECRRGNRCGPRGTEPGQSNSYQQPGHDPQHPEAGRSSPLASSGDGTHCLQVKL